MRILTCAVVVVSILCPPSTLGAQARGGLDSAQLAAMTANAMQLSKPAEFILQHRTDLALTAQQVSRLETLVVAQRDSVRVRMERRVSQIRARIPSPDNDISMRWTGDIDERALRDELCRRSEDQLDARLGLARDRRAAAAVLTPSQIASLPQIEMQGLLKALKRP